MKPTLLKELFKLHPRHLSVSIASVVNAIDKTRQKMGGEFGPRLHHLQGLFAGLQGSKDVWEFFGFRDEQTATLLIDCLSDFIDDNECGYASRYPSYALQLIASDMGKQAYPTEREIRHLIGTIQLSINPHPTESFANPSRS